MLSPTSTECELQSWFDVDDGLTVMGVEKDSPEESLTGGEEEGVATEDINRAVLMDWNTSKLTFYLDGEAKSLTRTVQLPRDWLLRFKMQKWPANTPLGRSHVGLCLRCVFSITSCVLFVYPSCFSYVFRLCILAVSPVCWYQV
jgi:hypothetical protein